jgi:DNA polymerase-3 subunit gamma/tau
LIAISEEMGSSSMSFSLALQDLSSLLQKISMAQVIPNSVLEEWPEAESVKRLAQSFTKEEVQLFYQIAITSRPDLSLAPDEEAGFMMALLRMLAFRPADGSGNAQPTQSPKLSTTPPAPKPLAKATPSNAAPTSAAPTSAAATQAPVAKEVSAPVEGVSKLAIPAPIDWQQLIKTFPLRGLVQQFAYQTELKTWQDMGSSIQVVVVTAMPQIATDDAIYRLCALLESHFNKPIKMKVEAGEAVKTVAVAQAKERQELQTSAEQEIASDPFVKSLEKEIGAQVISGTERPA